MMLGETVQWERKVGGEPAWNNCEEKRNRHDFDDDRIGGGVSNRHLMREEIDTRHALA